MEKNNIIAIEQHLNRTEHDYNSARGDGDGWISIHTEKINRTEHIKHPNPPTEPKVFFFFFQKRGFFLSIYRMYPPLYSILLGCMWERERADGADGRCCMNHGVWEGG